VSEPAPQILIVDDEPININILVDVLRDEWRTLVATNGDQWRAGVAPLPECGAARAYFT
jgi:CheY-like chemotaxis protein